MMRHMIMRLVICVVLGVGTIISAVRGNLFSIAICGALCAANGFSAYSLWKKGRDQ